MKDPSDFIGESKGSSEAISKAMLFTMILALLAVSLQGASMLISSQQNEAAYDQNVRTFIDYDDSVNDITDNQGIGFQNTATITQRISTFGAKLSLEGETTINIEGVDQNLTSKTMVLKKSEYEIIYDTKLIGGKTTNRQYMITSPIDGKYINNQTSIVPLITTNYNDSNMFEGSTTAKTILVSREYPPETKTVSSGTKIEVTTDHPFMWEEYFKSHQSIDYLRKADGTVEAELNRESKIYHYQVKVSST
jgi:hypothetical protein